MEPDDFEEGISLKREAVRHFGSQYLSTFSENFDLDRLRLICPLGSGAYAQVFLVKKEEECFP